MTVSTHVLDTSAGRPAAGLCVQLLRIEGATATVLSSAETSPDGRVSALVPPAIDAGAGAYRLAFEVGAYYASHGRDTFYGTVSIDFIVSDAAGHYHVPLLVSPFGYSTYRGS
ncbi:MAG TPA: hydroxyisourate hydrolase [Vicinamibacterales bacterium]|jgi:5-hydroxyisourate hydrolase